MFLTKQFIENKKKKIKLKQKNVYPATPANTASTYNILLLTFIMLFRLTWLMLRGGGGWNSIMH